MRNQRNDKELECVLFQFVALAKDPNSGSQPLKLQTLRGSSFQRAAI
jgi:hypothetical protein